MRHTAPSADIPPKDSAPKNSASIVQNHLDTAERIGQRICSSAIQIPGSDEPRCTWHVRTPDHSSGSDQPGGRRSQQEQASGLLYQGTAGIAYFLAQLHSVTGEAQTADIAKAGLGFALDHGQTLRADAWGMHSGRVGLAWVAFHASRIFEDPKLAEDGFALLQPLAGNAHLDRGLDVIGGAAGAIPALLDLRRLAGSEDRKVFLLQLAEDLGRHLLDQAQQEPTGWSWRTLPRSSIRNLLGLAHGTSGVAVALLELAQVTGRGDFRFTADMALLYERQFFDPSYRNWPDLRNVPLGEILRAVPDPQLRKMARAGALPPNQPSFMTAWCHGSPGVGLSRLRAWQLTGRQEHLDTVRMALSSTLPSLEPEALAHANFSLCHGATGNAELPLMASLLLNDDDLRERCEFVAAWGRRHQELESGKWLCGTFDGESDPSLLVGEAGIGLFYLRMAHPEIPTPLLLCPQSESEASDSELPDTEAGLRTTEYQEAAKQSISTFFSGTTNLWSRLGTSPATVAQHLPPTALEPPVLGPSTAESSDDAQDGSPASAAFAVLETLAAELPAPHADAFRVEREIFRRTVELDDFTAETLRSLARLDWQDLGAMLSCPERGIQFVLAADASLVVTDHDWPAWMAEQDGSNDSDDPLPPPELDPSAVLLIRQSNRMVARELAPLPAVILQAAKAPTTVEALCGQVNEALGGEAAPETLRSVVHAQLEQLYRAGFLDAHPESQVDGESGA